MFSSQETSSSCRRVELLFFPCAVLLAASGCRSDPVRWPDSWPDVPRELAFEWTAGETRGTAYWRETATGLDLGTQIGDPCFFEERSTIRSPGFADSWELKGEVAGTWYSFSRDATQDPPRWRGRSGRAEAGADEPEALAEQFLEITEPRASAWMVGPHVLGFFDLADRVPRVLGAERSFHLLGIEPLRTEVVHVRYDGLQELDAEGERRCLHAFVGTAPSWSVTALLDGRGLPAAMRVLEREGTAPVLELRSDSRWWLDAGEEWARRRDRERERSHAALRVRASEIEAPRVVPASDAIGRADDRSLRGLLEVPAGFAKRAPLAVLLPGDPRLDVDGNGVGGEPPYGSFLRELAYSLHAEGVATMRFLEGTGRSLSGRSESVMRMLEVLRQRPELDTDSLLLVGHSEGGLVALEVASQLLSPPLLALLGTPSRPLDEVLIEQARSVLFEQGAPERSIVRAEEGFREFFAWLREAGDPAAGVVPANAAAMLEWQDADSWREYLEFPALDRARGTVAPMLLLWGERDLLVRPSHGGAFAAARAKSDTQFHVIPGLDHFLAANRTGDPLRAAEPDRRPDPRALRVLRAFVREHLEVSPASK